MDKHDGALSLTNVAVMIGLYKLVTLHDLTLTELTAFLGTFGLYAWKKQTGLKAKAKAVAEGDVAKARQDASEALNQVGKARDELKVHTDKLRLMLDTVSLGRR